jgi:hypothetical protein
MSNVYGFTVTSHPAKVTIELCVGEIERAVDETEAALIASNRGLYKRGGLIVGVSFDKMPTCDGGIIETEIIEERGDYALLEDVDAVGKFLTYNAKEKKLKACPPPLRLIHTLKQRRMKLRLPTLVGLINCPSIKANGDLMEEPGYDPKTGILFDPLGVVFPKAPQSPTKEMAEAELKKLGRLIGTFKFVAPKDRAVALSLILTVIARAGLPSTPLHGFDAPVAGSGKSKLVDIASILATGHEAGVTAQGEDREEAEKRLSALLMRGDPLISIDNCELPLEGVLLNQALTQTKVELRILGKSKIVTARCASQISANGNNLVVKGDLTRRSIIGRLNPHVARPELLQFNYDPIEDAKQNRGELVVAALTILRAYHVAGRPDKPAPPQGFEKWSDTVRGALVWLGVGDPTETTDRIRKTDPILRDLRIMMHAWRTAFAATPTTVNWAIAAANETVTHKIPGAVDKFKTEFTRPDLRDALMGVAGRAGRLNNQALGFWLTKHSDRIVDLSEAQQSTELFAFEAAGERQGVVLWRLIERSQEWT